MSNQQHTPREIFNAARDCNILSVMNVCGSAADNAALTINENGGKFVQGHFTDEFVTIWINSVRAILGDEECEQEAIAWFNDKGIYP